MIAAAPALPLLKTQPSVLILKHPVGGGFQLIKTISEVLALIVEILIVR